MTRRRSLFGLFSIVVLALGLTIQALLPNGAGAAQITARSLTLQAGATDGGSLPGGTVNHQFAFTLPTTSGNLGSIEFLYCTLPGAFTDPCTPPTGLDTSTATLGTSTGDAFTSVAHKAANDIYITRAASPGAGNPDVEQLVGVVNPGLTTDTSGQTFFVRIATYASTDTTGASVDTGTVAAATVQAIKLNGTMPESLVFCTGGTVGVLNGVPDCTNITSGNIAFDRLFSPTDTALATSQMAASTNAGSGYSITVNGSTLTSGSNTITAMNPTDTSKHGISQFGMNLKLNATPAMGAEVAPAANGTNYKGEAIGGYATANSFRFVSGEAVADSANGGTAGGTDAQTFEVSYIVNVPGSQPAGLYTTTLTYICTATF